MNWLKRLFGRPDSPAPQNPAPADDKIDMASIDELTARCGHLYRPAVHLRPGAPEGFSRLGGLPEMPAHLEWPTWEGKPQAFLAQLDLGEIHRVLPSFLPSSGHLYFFYNQEQGVWGFDPNDLGGWRVLYAQGKRSDYVERAAPSGVAPEYVYRPKPVVPQRVELLPDWQCLPSPPFTWDRDGEKYHELRSAAFGDFHRHQVLGYPSPVQNADMETECQLASNGIYVGTAEGYQDPRVAELKGGSKDWKLLLQLDTDDDCGWMWGDVGTLYFWIREQDARAGDFSRVWMVFQCS